MSQHDHAYPELRDGSSRQPAIEASNLVKTYGKGGKGVRAVDGVSFTVASGSIFGLLGPNGAGKSTTVKVLTTLAAADEGTATVAGYDVARQAAEVRAAIGYIPQKPCFDPTATGRENLILQGRIHGLPGNEARRRADDLMQRFGLTDAADRITKTWSGGMQRKLDIALGLIHRPQVLFLDEPTTGLDPEARTDMWAEISALAKIEGLTVMLTTHYLDEADHLADQLVIVDRGTVVAEGTPAELKGHLDGDTVQIHLTEVNDRDRAHAVVAGVSGVERVDVDTTALHAHVDDGASALPRVLTALEAAGIGLSTVTVARPSLDDVYLRFAGRTFQAADHAGAKEESK
jgi:ABC-2 type transport system ATP-binding protein